jgi:beta-lactam-binding protein with PASTA domain
MANQTIKNIFKVLKHLVIASSIVVIGVMVFFYVYLPYTTNHGETITVPNVVNQHLNDLDDILVTRSLRYEVNIDSGYSADQEPLTVLDQFPLPNSKVKENRKVYVTLNATSPPLVRMPDLIDKSLMISQTILQSYGLKVGETEYKEDLALNVVLEQWYNGEQIVAGDMVPKGSEIDLFIGDGHGRRFWEMFSYINQPLDDARFAIAGTGLKIGDINYTNDPMTVISSIDDEGNTIQDTIFVSIGYVVDHDPGENETVKIQDFVDLWVYQPDSINTEQSILE